MKRKIVGIFLSGIMTASVMTGCGSSAGTAASTAAASEAPASTAASTEAVAEASSETPATEEASDDVYVAPDETYTSPDGWSVRYDVEKFIKNEAEDEVSFVYQGESAGTCLLSIKTVRDKKAKDIIEEIKKANAEADKIDESESTFPGTENVTGYWIYPQYKEGNGLSEDFIIGDFDGFTLVFDFLTHKSGDDEIDIPISDYLALIIDSFEYIPGGASAEAAAEGEDEAAEFQHIDITGCDTFTQIVDRLGDGQGYANAAINGEDMLFVASGTFNNDGKDAAIDSEIFYYKDGVPTSVDIVAAGGTAYPLAIKDGILYVGNNHGMTKYSFDSGKLTVAESIEVVYDNDGNETYTYTKDGKTVEQEKADSEKKFNELFDEIAKAEVIEFSTVK